VAPTGDVRRGPWYSVGTGISFAGLAAFLSLFGAPYPEDVHRLIVAGASFALMIVGAVIRDHDRLEKRVPRLEPGTWHLVRTKPEETGD
jgi:hypothetical protein